MSSNKTFSRITDFFVIRFLSLTNYQIFKIQKSIQILNQQVKTRRIVPLLGQRQQLSEILIFCDHFQWRYKGKLKFIEKNQLYQNSI